MEQTPQLFEQTPRRPHITDTVAELARPVLASLGLTLWGIEYNVAGRGYLRLFIEADPQGQPAERDGMPETPPAQSLSADDAAGDDAPTRQTQNISDGVGPSVDECAHASRLIGMRLEVEDLIDIPYVLEVSSPGLERRFFRPEQFPPYAGSTVDLHFHSAPDGHGLRKRFRGILQPVAGDAGEDTVFSIMLEEASDEESPDVSFRWQDLKKAQLVYIDPPKGHTPKKRMKTGGVKK